MGNPNPNQDGLKKFKPGQSGNPAGRPPGRGIADIFNALLERVVTFKDPFDNNKETKITVKERLAISMMVKAMKGGEKAMEIILDRTDGKVALPMKLSGSVGGRAPVQHVDLSGVDTKVLERALAKLAKTHADEKKKPITD